MMKNLFKVLLMLLLLRFNVLDGAPPDKSKPRTMLPSICYKQNGVIVPMVGSCSGFYVCVDGHAVASSCGDFYHYNAVTGVCDHPDKAGCLHYEIDEDIVDGYVDEEDYYDIDEPVEIAKFPTLTPPYAPPLPKPKEPEEVRADEAAGLICVNEDTGTLLPKMDSCSQYYVCINHRAYRRTCPLMLHFNATRKLCQDPALAQCPFREEHEHKPLERKDEKAPLRSEQPGLVSQPAKMSKVEDIVRENIDFDLLCTYNVDNRLLLRHPRSCDRFIFCSQEKALVLMCPAGEEFNENRQRCEAAELAKCRVQL